MIMMIMNAHLRLASCSRTLWRLSWSLCYRISLIVDLGEWKNTQCEKGSVWLWISYYGHFKHQVSQRSIEVKGRVQSMGYDLFGQAFPIMWQILVIGERIHHRTRPSN